MTLATVSTLCGIYTFLLSGSPITYSATPRGTCSTCCEIIERDDIKFMLYTRKNQFQSQFLYLNDEKRLRKSNFNFNYPLAIYLHGFSELATGEKQSSQEVKDAFLKSDNYNVILVDWSPLTAAPWYTNSLDNFPIAGRYVARFIRFLLDRGYQVKKIHLIGFSLGAEVAGFIGKQLNEWDIYLPRVTGLDPALPFFEEGGPYRHLNPRIAKFVDIIHTDGGIFGNLEAMGHADFYPNGGHAVQPGCARQEIANNRWFGIILGCSHRRAWEYFIESIHRPFAFQANRCEPSKLFGSCRYGNGKAFMGMGADKRLRGEFFLQTNDDPPYGRNTLGTVKKDNNIKNSDALTLLPGTQKQMHELLHQQQQQLNNNVTRESVQGKGNVMMDVVTATMTAAIKSNSVQAKDLTWSATADGWNSVSSDSKTNLPT